MLQGLGELKQADEYLAQAEWTVLKSSDSTNAIKSKLYRNIGILYATKGDYENALRVFAEDVKKFFQSTNDLLYHSDRFITVA